MAIEALDSKDHKIPCSIRSALEETREGLFCFASAAIRRSLLGSLVYVGSAAMKEGRIAVSHKLKENTLERL